MTDLHIQFGPDTTDWYVVNDGVMGGLSQGTIALKETSILFTGTVSLENNGGFSSLRSPFSSYDLSKYQTVVITYRSSGMNFAFNLATSKRWFDPVYRTSLIDTNNQWTTLEVSLTDFKEVVIGRATGNRLKEDQLDQIIRLGFITNEKKASPFSLEVASIEFK